MYFGERLRTWFIVEFAYINGSFMTVMKAVRRRYSYHEEDIYFGKLLLLFDQQKYFSVFQLIL